MKQNQSIPGKTNPKNREIQKQISMFIPLSQWKVIRLEAAKQKIPITELCRRWMRPGLSELLTEKSDVAFPNKLNPK